MYGYFRPHNSYLTSAETNVFHSHYCRVCYCLRLIGGQVCRFCTTYDAAVYSMIINLQKGEDNPPFLPCEKVRTTNMQKFRGDVTGIKLANLTLIGFGEKFRDDQIDHNGKSRFARMIFAKAIKRAVAAEPKIAQIMRDGNTRVNELQNGGADIFAVLGAYGDMTAEIFAEFLDMTPQTEALLRAVGEWTFFVDMACDYADDVSSGDYNGLKTADSNTFEEYFEKHYTEFFALEQAVTGKLLAALDGVKDNSRTWNTLYKIIIHSVNTVLPSLATGGDVKFHYFSNLFWRYGEAIKLGRDIKRLGVRDK